MEKGLVTENFTKRIVLLKQEPYWEAELRRRFGDLEKQLTVCRNAAEVRAHLRTRPTDLLLCSWHPIHGDLLLLISEAIELELAGRVIVLYRKDDEDLEWNLREMGVVAVLRDQYDSAREVERYCRLPTREC